MTEVLLLKGILGEAMEIAGRDCLRTRAGDVGVVVYGPYEQRGSGQYEVTFRLALADEEFPLGDPVCATIEVVTRTGTVLVADRRVLFSELSHQLTSFKLPFALIEPREVEYRVRSAGQLGLLISTSVDLTQKSERGVRFALENEQDRRWQNERQLLDGFLQNVSGLIHIGANLGQERRYYALFGIDVIWVEPISEVYQLMVDNITRYPRQTAFNALLTDREGDEVEFRIASNNGASSSILPFEDHAVLYPDIQYVEHRKIVSTTLAALIEQEKIPINRYQALTLDVEGAEMMILKGAGEYLNNFLYIKCEAADFPARTGTPTVAQLDEFLRPFGYRQLVRKQFGLGPNDRGTYWDVVWKREIEGQPFHAADIQLPTVVDPFEVEGIEKCE